MNKLDFNLEKFVGLRDIPKEYINYVCGHTSYEEFILSGAEVFLIFELALNKYFNKKFSSLDNILDFGCGAGRLIQFLLELNTNVYGCDVNSTLINYLKKIGYANLYKNNFIPPLKYESNFFQFIQSFSVFSHLAENDECIWLEELFRIGSPGCIYFITIHGEWVIQNILSKDEQSIAKTDGFLFKNVHTRSSWNKKMNFPDGYECSFHTTDYIYKNWSKYFDIIDIIPGDGSQLYQDSYFKYQNIFKKIRPMGQDLVIAKKNNKAVNS